MGRLNKKEIMGRFENYLDEIMSEDKSKFLDMSQIIKAKVSDIGDKILEDWVSEKVVNEKNGNKLIQYDENLKKK